MTDKVIDRAKQGNKNAKYAKLIQREDIP